MKYFTYALIAAANDWIEQSEIELQEAGKSFDTKVEEYHSELEGLRARISQKAWDFFRYGANEYGLHDGTLISLTVGDGLDSPAEGSSSSSRLKRRATSCRIEFINFEQEFHYSFELIGLRNLSTDLSVSTDIKPEQIGDLYTYELTGVDNETLRISFLFASGSHITARFRKLVFRRKRCKARKTGGLL